MLSMKITRKLDGNLDTKSGRRQKQGHNPVLSDPDNAKNKNSGNFVMINCQSLLEQIIFEPDLTAFIIESTDH